MPTFQGFEVRTHPLPGGRKVDVLQRPGHPRLLWVPGPQVADLSGEGHRSDGSTSTSDLSWSMSLDYILRVPDPDRVYSRTRIKGVTLFAVEGLIQKAFHTTRRAYVDFCREFIERVLPGHAYFVAHNHELVEAWIKSLNFFDGNGACLAGARFRAAVRARDERLAKEAGAKEAPPTPPPGLTADEVRAIIREELVRLAQVQGELAGVVAAVDRLAGIATEQLAMTRQSVDLVTPSHQLFLPASDYIEADGVADALKRAPRLAEPVFGLDHCPDHGKASLFMKRLCRDENKKIGANAAARIVADKAGEELPPLYIPQYLMKKLTREHVKMLMFTPPCWARLRMTFLPAAAATVLFPVKEA